MDLFDDHLRFCVAIYMGNITTLLSLRKIDKSWCECVFQVIKFQIMTLYPSILPLPTYTLSIRVLWLIYRRVYGFGIRIVCPDGSHTYTLRKQVDVSTRMVLGRRHFELYTFNENNCKFISRRHVEFSFEGVTSSGGIGTLKCLGLNGCTVHYNYPTTDIKCYMNQSEDYILGFYDKIEISEDHFLYVEPIESRKRFLVDL